jgi:hypothetical protein
MDILLPVAAAITEQRLALTDSLNSRLGGVTSLAAIDFKHPVRKRQGWATG